MERAERVFQAERIAAGKALKWERTWHFEKLEVV